MTTQLPLNLTLKESTSFENFSPGRNREALTRLESLARGSGHDHTLFIWGESGCGKTHLLQSACRLAQAQGRLCAYVPLASASELSSKLLEDLERCALVCVDDVQHIAGDRSWEAALFHCYERLRQANSAFVASGIANPRHLRLHMPELATRLGSGPVYHLHLLTDTEKLAVLRGQAQRRGLELPEEVARYILERYPRDLHVLFRLLERLDRASLAEQRRLTIPFIRSLE